jgi:2-polyprenyl-6-methoxyphenol hydroxylase-like FAD-dependent oxidoreductase
MNKGVSPSLPIVIAGAGIGGLTAALALRRNGHEVLVLEKAEEVSEVGAGLQLSSNACNVLNQLGVLDALEPHAFAPENLRISSGKTGTLLAHVPLGDFVRKRYGSPFWVVHRADLQQVLLQLVRETSGITVQLASEVQSLESSPYDHLQCKYETNGTPEKLECSALIGADGVWSKTRKLIPGHENARFSGQVAYRATIPIDEVPERWHGDSGLWLHKNAHLVHYQIRGGNELNIVALVEEPWEDETWSAKADKETLKHVLKDWPTEILNLISIPDQWLKWALCSVDSAGPWTHGHVALMGDAAHAMLPYMAQGAAMAIEDAAILAKHLPGNAENIPASLRSFERQRKSRVAHIQAIARKNAQVFHFSGIPAIVRNTVLRYSKPEALTARFDDIYGWRSQQ